MNTLEYYFENGDHVIFDKYTIDTFGIIRNKKTGKTLGTSKLGKYNIAGVSDNNQKLRRIRICRAILSTFEGRPPSFEHTADHMDRNRENDMFENIRWLCKKGQSDNRERPDTYKSAFIIVRNELEKTAKEWAEYLKNKNNPFGRPYTEKMIGDYARKKQHDFMYKEYPDLQGEIWKEVECSKTTRGSWKISNMNRVKYITKYAENVLEGERIGFDALGYPTIGSGRCHILAFMAFFPEDWAAKKPEHVVLHQDDDKLDFIPHKLRLGTHGQNRLDAHDNGKYDGKKTGRMKCASYINGILEREYDSQSDARDYLKSIGYEKASVSSISRSLIGKQNMAYERTWTCI